MRSPTTSTASTKYSSWPPFSPARSSPSALNYSTHLGERPAPKRVEGFYKPHNCIIADGEDIVLPEGAGRVDEEGELVAIIGKTCSKVSKEDALDYVMGYTIGNDVSARDWQNGPEKDMQWWRAKGADTFGPLGPSSARTSTPLTSPFRFPSTARRPTTTPTRRTSSSTSPP